MEKKFKGIVLVIDPQMGWLNQYTEPAMKRLQLFLSDNIILKKTIITTFSNTQKSNFRKLMSEWKGFTGEDDIKIIPGFEFSGVPVYKRRTYGLPERFWKELKRTNVNNLLITGVETDASIIKTAMDSFDRGISAWIAEDLVASTYGRRGQTAGISVARKVLGRDHVLETPDMLQEDWFI